MDRGAWWATVHGVAQVRQDYYFNMFQRDDSAGKESACSAGDTGNTSLTP